MFRDKLERLVLSGDGSFKFQAIVEGEDIVVRNVWATWFGGKDDKDDNKDTASGVLNNQEGPQTPPGCALPMSGCHCRRTEGSPLPKIPWHTHVRVSNQENGRTVIVPLIDIGPAKPPFAYAAIDLTQSTFAALGGDKRRGRFKVEYRILGGSRYIRSFK